MRQHQQQLVVTAASLVALLLSRFAEAQTTVLSHPYKANTRHNLPGERGQQCSWFVRRGGSSNPFQRVEVGTNLVREGLFRGDLNIFLNEETKGTYRCLCRMNGEEMDELRTEVYLYSEAQRFHCPAEVAVVKGEPVNVSVCYLPFLPEAANLKTVTLVDEVTKKQEIKTLRNYCATYIMNVSQPGFYHFQVSTGEHGHINSASFNVTLQDPPVTATPTPTPASTDPPDTATPTPTPASTVPEWIAAPVIVPVALFILFLVFGSVVIHYVLKWRDRKCHNNNPRDGGAGNPPAPPLQGNRVNDAPPQVVVVVDANQQANDGAGDPPAPPLQGNHVDAPPQVVVDANQRDNDGTGDPPDHPLQGNDNILPDAVAHDNPPANGAGDLPAPPPVDNDVIVPDNQQDDDVTGAPDNGATVELAMPTPAENSVSLSCTPLVARYAPATGSQQVDVECVTGENLPPPQEERNRQSQEQQRPEECTDRNLSCRPVDAIHRKASTSSGDFQRISRSWLQHPANSPNRSTSEASMAGASYVRQTSVEDSLNAPKPFK